LKTGSPFHPGRFLESALPGRYVSWIEHSGETSVLVCKKPPNDYCCSENRTKLPLHP
jgi:hypothetical protein